MNVRTVVIIGLIGVFGLLVMPSARADWIFTGNVYNGTISVSGHDYSYASSFHSAGEKVTIAFQCLDGSDETVDFVVCDAGDLYLLESQSGSWEMQGSFIGYLQSIHFRGPIQVERMNSWEGDFEVSHPGTWFYLFSNMFTLTTKTVQLRVESYQWRDPVILGMGASILALCILGTVAALAVHYQRKPR